MGRNFVWIGIAMIEKWVKQLGNSDANKRKEAIKALAQAKDSAALKFLAAVYKNDPDPAVREMALKAGRYLKQQADNAKLDTSAPTPPTLPPTAEKVVTREDEIRARSYLDSALDYHIRGDNGRAYSELSRAFSLNPKLKEEGFVVNLAKELTGLDGDAAIARLSAPTPARPQSSRWRLFRRRGST
jgi:hypothetical protein